MNGERYAALSAAHSSASKLRRGGITGCQNVIHRQTIEMQRLIGVGCVAGKLERDSRIGR